ncbi:MAG: von Willebrand factor type [Flaviaesturariibacter sp.]|nr:von Willebrand factor type [Flaviaesturariibacter sp.]
MTSLFKAFLCASGAVILLAFTHSSKTSRPASPPATVVPKIQVAILLDVSSSMNGLIEQAKIQLWNMVSVMGKAKCAAGSPGIEIALYEYGRSSNNSKAGYIRRLSPFTTDLDTLSQSLFSLTTDGGDEYCGQVIHTAIDSLAWDSNPQSYKVIFIAGNEDFLQGSITYTSACDAASRKGVIVNTIYCGPRAQGILEHWNLGSKCGAGSFTVIDQDAQIEDIPTPYDSALMVLNSSLNNTYIGYGSNGRRKKEVMGNMDVANYGVSTAAGIKRVQVKGNSRTYNNASWDLVDAARADSAVYRNLAPDALPDSLRNKSGEELKAIVSRMSAEREAVQNNIADLSAKRESWLLTARRNRPLSQAAATLESQVEAIIRAQAGRFHMTVD